MKNVLVLGYHGYENCGDDAILISIKNTLERIGENINIVVLSNKPKHTKKVYGVNAVYRFNPLSILNAVGKCDVLLCGGGTLLQDGTSTRSIRYYLGVLSIAKMLGKKVILYSNGIGPIDKKANRDLTAKVINKVDTITFREQSSKSYLESIGVEKPKMLVTADPAFGLPFLDKNDYKYIFEQNDIPAEKDMLGVSLRKWKNKEYFIEQIARICDEIIENKNMNVVFLNMQFEHDKKISELVMSKMKNKAYMINQNLRPLEVLGVTANFKTMISMRLHGIIFAGKQRVPVCGLIYDPKVDYYLNVLDMPSIGNIDEIDEKKAITIISDILDNYEEKKEKLAKVVIELEGIESINGEEVKKLMDR